MNTTKHVVLAFTLAGEPGRRKLNGVFRYLTEHGLNWRIQLIRMLDDFSASFVRSFPERGIDGVIYSFYPPSDVAAELARITIPTIAVDCFDDELLQGRRRNIIYISSSPEEIGQTAALHLLAQGIYRSYAFVPDPHQRPWSKPREQAFVREIQANGIPVTVYRNHRRGYDLPQLTAWLSHLPRPIGLFAAFDDRAVQVLEACHDAGLAIPQDVAVISVDNDEVLCTNTQPPLTSIQPDHEQIGLLAAERLEAMMNGERLNHPEHHRIKVKSIVVRDSTSAVSPSGRLVQRALAFIRMNAARPIRTRDVVAFLKVSRRLADLRFRELQGMSIGEAIREHRLNEVARRLVDTNDKIADIAEQLGFPKLSRLREAFRLQFGTTMTDYRLKKLPRP